MENPGERLVGDYLRYIKNCDFIDFNVYTKRAQGEIDVIGVNAAQKQVYVCEVATHLTTGIQYVNAKAKRPETSDRLVKKFVKDIDYGNEAFGDYAVTYMLWSPVVRRSDGNPANNQFEHMKKIAHEIKAKKGVDIVFVINDAYLKAVGELRVFARNETKELKSPVMRFLQIEEWSKKNSDNIKRRELKDTGMRLTTTASPV